MITYFRKLRHKLLSENRFTRYLIYAIGEIFLVVVGILIALQINNWNAHKKEEGKLSNALADVRREISFNNQSGESILQILHSFEEYGRILFDLHVNHEAHYPDSVIGIAFRRAAFPLPRLYRTRKYTALLDASLYDELVADSLKEELSTYYLGVEYAMDYIERSNINKEPYFQELSDYYTLKTLAQVNGEFVEIDYDLEQFRNNKQLNPVLAELVDINSDMIRMTELSSLRGQALISKLQ